MSDEVHIPRIGDIYLLTSAGSYGRWMVVAMLEPKVYVLRYEQTPNEATNDPWPGTTEGYLLCDQYPDGSLWSNAGDILWKE